MRLFVLLLIVLSLSIHYVCAEEPLPLPPGASVYGDAKLDDFHLMGQGAGADFTTSVVKDMPFDQAIHVHVDARTANAWDVQIETPLSTITLKKDEYILAVFSVRCTAAPNNVGMFNAFIQDNGPPWVGLAQTDVVAGQEWQRVYIHGKAIRDFLPGKYELTLHLGTQAQTLEFGGFSLLDLGPNVDIDKLPFARISYPGTTAFTMWGYWQGSMWNPSAALVRKDWSLKPNGKMWMNLVHKEWWTDTTATTDAVGACKTRGFLGDYKITVTAGDKTQSTLVTLTKAGADSTVTLN